ncbi:MAG TPA: nicotinate-nucleotide--dimethylbenzimidazole phosphoribosyltransferase [Acidimicrobiales bacterium]
MTDELPFDAILFTPGSLLIPDPSPDTVDRTVPGARRAVSALTQWNLPVGVVVDPNAEPHGPLGPAAVAAELQALGFGELPVVADEGALARVARTLVVTGEHEAGPPPPDGSPLRVAGIGNVVEFLAGAIGPFRGAAMMVGPLDSVAAELAFQRHLQLTKPPGSLGRLEALGVQLSAISGQVPPPLPTPATVAIFAADHGVHVQGVSPWPQEVTTQMVMNFLSGGAAINVLARHADADVVVVDVGVAGDLPAAEGLIHRKVARGTYDLAVGPAMSREQALYALDVGAEVALGLVRSGSRCLLTGDMGIANTTASAALVVALTGRRAGDITGRGAGLAAEEVPRKATIVADAAARAVHTHRDDALGILAEVGGLEHAALAGYIVAGVALGVPVIVDGVIAASALLVAARLVPGVEAAAIAGHRSVEPGSDAVLQALEMAPVVDLDLRLGEGTGAALALPIVEAAARLMAEMATFDQAGVSSKTD